MWINTKRQVIDSFKGSFFYLSNFYPAPIEMGEFIFPTSEHMYQAAKSNDMNQWKEIIACGSPAEAKRLGRHLTLRPDWEQIKIDVMTEIVELKFKQNKELYWKLWATRDYDLVESNTWGDTFWGVCNGVGENHLGIILMNIRDRSSAGFKEIKHVTSNSNISQSDDNQSDTTGI